MEKQENDSTLVSHIERFNRITEMYLKEKTVFKKHVLDVLMNPDTSETDRILAKQLKLQFDSVYGTGSGLMESNPYMKQSFTFNNIKAVLSPTGYGKTKFLVEEAIAMSEYGKVLFISHDNTVQKLKELVFKNNVNNIGHYENICICYYPNISNEENKMEWLTKNLEKAISDYDFSYVIIDSMSMYGSIEELDAILSLLYIKFNRLLEIIVSVQLPEEKNNVSNALKFMNNIPKIVEIKKDRVIKDNGDTYGTFEIIKNCGINKADSTETELYHYKGNFLLRRAV